MWASAPRRVSAEACLDWSRRLFQANPARFCESVITVSVTGEMLAMSLARAVALCLWFAVTALAAPPLTTIEDVLYKADGKPFQGLAVIQWKTFQAADGSTIATSSIAVPVVNGLFRVQLVPTTNASPGAYYTVRYLSEGRVVFEESWAVAPSPVPLKLKDVRVAGPLPSGAGGVLPPATQTQIQQSDVLGLPEELAARPVKGGQSFRLCPRGRNGGAVRRRGEHRSRFRGW